jgi:hypothetical protein
MKYSLSNDKFVAPGVRISKPYDPSAPKSEPTPEPVEQETEEVEEVVEATPAPTPVAKPVQPVAKKKKSDLPPGVLRWGDQSVGGFKGSRIQQCIIYQILLAKNSYWTRIINGGRGYLSQPEVIAKLVGDTPEDFVWDEEGVIGWQRRHPDGETHAVVSKFVRRKPKNEEERELVRNTFGVTPHTRKLLAREDCPVCHGSGSYKVRPYEDNPHLTAHVECKCPWE